MDFSVVPDDAADAEAMLSLSDAARYLGTFRPKLYQLITSRRLRAYRMLGRRHAIYVRKGDLDAIRPLLPLRPGGDRAGPGRSAPAGV